MVTTQQAVSAGAKVVAFACGRGLTTGDAACCVSTVRTSYARTRPSYCAAASPDSSTTNVYTPSTVPRSGCARANTAATMATTRPQENRSYKPQAAANPSTALSKDQVMSQPSTHGPAHCDQSGPASHK